MADGTSHRSLMMREVFAVAVKLLGGVGSETQYGHSYRQ